MTRKVLIFGLATGFINIIIGLSTAPLWMEHMDFSTGEILGYVSILLALTMVYIEVRSYRDSELDGVISFGKALGVGVLIVLIASVIYVIGWSLYYKYMMPDFQDRFLDYSIMQINQSDFTETEKQTQIKEMTSWMESYKNPLVMMAFTFLEFFPIGFIVALISAFILSRKKS
ncbi:DUF4199 domain-containing protein [Chondrinema litorale]|uniref:DUF4199 domain-containing protein n=1 Tax=Chondrinema litorale TaxID=2994555 RepID=UPI00254331DC|nr:DUF4199 domain-containing protein [Chondrinema litorale]UZR98606.1 DUF4199 domain-containing protein [Chondrinema litorale]